MSLPENHVVAEGRTLLAAREAAAVQLGVPVNAVEHKLDLAHFKASGTAGAATVKIFAWAKDMAGVAPAMAAEAWIKALLETMGRQATVRAEMRGDQAVVFVDAGDAARHLVGRQGTTLRAIEHLLARNVGGAFPDVNFRIDVARNDDGPPRDRDDRPRDRDDRPRDDRPRDDRPRDDRPRPPRDDRGERRFDRPREDRPRDDRPRDDRPRDDRPRGPRDDRGDRGDRPRRNDGEALKSLARKLASKVRETGEPEVIRRELNSFDRRLVHLEVADIEGVASRSVGEGSERRVEIYVPAAADGAGE